MARSLTKLYDVYGRAIKGSEALLRELCRTDLFFLLTIMCRRRDLFNDWFLSRCDEVQVNPDGHLDLWAREHGKSSVITFGKTLQDILIEPEVTIGIFSHTRPIAKDFLRPIKREFEANEPLKRLFCDVLWENPEKQAPVWSMDGGLVVKRKGNPKEATVEAWGLVEGMPVGRHFDKLVFDDIVTKDNAGSEEMRAKTLEAWSHALNLGKRGGVRRIIGTRYHFGDAYGEIQKREAATPRVYPAEIDGEPVLLSREELDDKRREMGPYVYASQMMLDPREDSAVGFKVEWLRQTHAPADGNTYIIVDPANSKRKKSDYTAAWVVTAAADRNFYVKWFTRDRLSLVERIELVMWMHREFQPDRVGYEQYGMQADIEAIQQEQDRQRYRFEITPLGGQVAKFDRIQRLAPLFEQGRIYLPQSLFVSTKDSGELVDMVTTFIEDEYSAWPYASHDDMLDALARIADPDFAIRWPGKAMDVSHMPTVVERAYDVRAW